MWISSINYLDNNFLKFGSSFNFRIFFRAIIDSGENEWGYFESNNKYPSCKIIDYSIFHHYKEQKLNENFRQEYYLDKIIKLCVQNKIRLVLISCPVHQRYRQNIENKYFNKLALIIEKNPKIEYQNYLGLNIDSKYMADANHLNAEGGKLISVRIKKNLDTFMHNKAFKNK